jgi:hypothetical protein
VLTTTIHEASALSRGRHRKGMRAWDAGFCGGPGLTNVMSVKRRRSYPFVARPTVPV